MGTRSHSFVGSIKSSIGRIGIAVAFAVISSGLPLIVTNAVQAAPSNVNVCDTGCNFPDIQAAIDGVDAGSTITLLSQTYAISAPININKSVTITGQPGRTSVIQVAAPTGNVFTVNANNVAINGLKFVATTAATFSFIGLNGNNTTISNNSFNGQFTLDAAGTDGSVSRGLVGGGGKTGLAVSGNTFNKLRQPAYFDAVSGTITNNKVSGTKGWVAVSQSNLNFGGNTWGSGAAKNAVDIAIIKDPGVQPDNYITNLMAMSSANNNAVIEDQVPATGRVLTDVFVDDSAATGGNGYPITPYQAVTPAFARVVEGGRIHVANGTYTEKLKIEKNGTEIIGESRDGVILTPLSNEFGQGLTAENLSNITIRRLTVKATPASGNAAIKIHNGTSATINNVNVVGPTSGTPGVNGIDINGVRGVILNNVSVSDATKNGIALTSQFAAGDVATGNVNINNVSSTNNAWSGLAFYTSNNAGTLSANIDNVKFTGTNSFSNNGQVGIYFQGDSNANFTANAAPRYTVTGPSNGLVDLGTSTVTGNGVNITNYQTKGVKAFQAVINGKTGTQMNATERTAADATIVDFLDRSNLGLVAYYTLSGPTNLLPVTGTVTSDPAFVNSWNAVPGAAKYEYRTSNTVNGDGTLGSIIYSDNSTASNYTVTPTTVTRTNNGTPQGTYYWQVRAIDALGNPGDWSVVNAVTVDTTAPTVPTNGLPHNSFKTTNEFDFTWNASSDSSAVTYEFQSTTNPARSGGVLTTGLWKSGVLNGPMIHSSGAGDGTWYWQVRAKDAAGNYSAWSSIWNVKLDTTAPAAPGTVSLTDSLSAAIPNNGFTKSYNVTANWASVGDADHYVYRYWNNIPGSGYNSAATAYTVDTSSTNRSGEFNQGEGTHYIQVQSIDAAGNASAWSAPFVVTYDKTAPTTAITTPTIDQTINDSTVTIIGTVDDTNIDFYETVLRAADTTVVSTAAKTYTRVLNDTIGSFDISTLANGTYTIEVTATDKAGNSTLKTVSFAINRVLPMPEAVGGFGTGASTVVTTANRAAAPTQVATAPVQTGAPAAATDANTATGTDATVAAAPTVLGDSKTEPQAKSASTAPKVESSNKSNFLGLGWWWVLILAIAAAAIYWLYKRRASDSEA